MTTAFGKYVLLQRLASGGMGEVYLARAPGARGFDKKVVIKRILPHLAEEPGFLELFLDEARIAAQLNHPNVAQIFDLGEVDGAWYLTMEYISGQDLRRVMHRVQTTGQQSVPMGLTLRIISDAAAALDYAHRARDAEGRPLNIVHRDVSPHNILIGFDGGVKLIDFGVAKAANRIQNTATGLLRGKFPYMSPEQVEGQPVDGRSDVFSLGVVLWEVLTGFRLFKADNDAATVRLVSRANVEPPSRSNPLVPPAVDALCLKATSRDPAARFQDAAAMRMAVEEVIMQQHLPASSAHLEAFMRTLFPESSGEEAVPTRLPRPNARANDVTVGIRKGEQTAATRIDPRLVPKEKEVRAPTAASGPDPKGTRALPAAPMPAAEPGTVSVPAHALLEELVGRKGRGLFVPQTRFVGRERVLRAIQGLFDRDERFVTLVGPGGTGKTRLADQFAQRRQGTFRLSGGAFWCDLTGAEDLEGICLALGRALNVPLAPGRSTRESVAQLGQVLGGVGDALIVFDNFEQVVSHARASVGVWFDTAPDVRILVTSREPTGVPGEAAFEVPPMELPKMGATLASVESVELFVDRARAARPGYAPSEVDLAGISEIVRQLDGLPLAIELAAARMAVLSPGQLAQRLPRRFELLKGNAPDVTPRQATLKGAIDWSWQLLQPWEQSAFAQLGAFRGGFDFEAAEAVLSLDAWPQAPWVLDVVQTLKSKSLVRALAPQDQPEVVRFGLLESLREYAVDKLRASEIEAQTHARHAEHYLRLGLTLAQEADGPGALRALDRLQLERDNLLQVFQRAVQSTHATTEQARRGLEAVIALSPLMLTRGPFSHQLTMFDAALRRAEGARIDPLLRARALGERGRARQMRGQLALSLEDFAQALSLLQSAGGAPAEEARLQHFTGNALRLLGRRDEAEAALRQALAVEHTAQDLPLQARIVGSLAALEQERGRIAEAVRHYERALALHRAVGDRRFEGVVLGNLGALEQDRGNRDEARARYDEALAIHIEVGNRRSEGVVLANLGSLYRDTDSPEEARAHYRRAVAIHREVGDRRFEGIALAALAGLEHEANRLADAQVKYEQAVGILEKIGDRTWEALARAGLATALADDLRFEGAESSLEKAEALLAAIGDGPLLAVARVCRAHLACARAEALPEDDEASRAALWRSAREHVHAVEQGPGDDAPSLTEQSANLREALRCLRKRHALPA